jgi:hypothetical protein
MALSLSAHLVSGCDAAKLGSHHMSTSRQGKHAFCWLFLFLFVDLIVSEKTI